jgi:hypothetical protein
MYVGSISDIFPVAFSDLNSMTPFCISAKATFIAERMNIDGTPRVTKRELLNFHFISERRRADRIALTECEICHHLVCLGDRGLSHDTRYHMVVRNVHREHVQDSASTGFDCR